MSDNNEPTDRDRAWNWIESKSRFTDPTGSYAWLWNNGDNHAEYTKQQCESIVLRQARTIWHAIIPLQYANETQRAFPLRDLEDFPEFLERSDYHDAVAALENRVQEAKKALLSDCFERFMASLEVERAIDLATHQHDFGDVTARIELFADQTWRILPSVGNLYNSAGVLVAPGVLEDSERATDDVSASYDNAIEVTRRNFEMIWES